jgi:murein L,D-transpeptidase YcbB/YkuD
MKNALIILSILLNSLNVTNAQNDYFTLQSIKLNQYVQEIEKKITVPYPKMKWKRNLKLNIGDRNALIPAIKEQLFFWGDLKSINDDQLFDSTLYSALQQFRFRNGLDTPTILDEKVVGLLNIPPKEILSILKQNLKRVETVQLNGALSYIVVNIPECNLNFFVNNTCIVKMAVIVGKPQTPTRTFQTKITAMVFCPYWNVPRSIMLNEILPALKRDSHYLIKHHMEWRFGRIRQKPGPWNALGEIKFVIPNTYGIYMHDTPTKYLFKKRKRYYSHGCIRLERALDLASNILIMENMNQKEIEEIKSSSVETMYKLNRPIQINVVYQTATVDESGRLMLWNDVYSKDN